MSKLLQNISISQNLPSTKTTLIFTCFTLIFSIIYILNYPSNTLLSISSTLTSQFFSFSNSTTTNNNTNNNNVCDIFDGRWIYDESHNPIYQPGSCPYTEREFNCFGNGRSDLGYLKYRWQPYGCNIPRFDAKKMMEMLRGKKLVFVGDSLNRNMCQSLVCSLKMFKGQSSRSGGFYSYDFKFVTAPFLVQPHRISKKRETLRLDTIEASISKYRDADVLIFNTGHWENFFQEGDVVHSKMDVGVNRNKTQVFFVGFSNTHFGGGDWNSGGTCNNETVPITDEKQLTPYPKLMQSLETVISKMKTPISYLNITKLTDYRKDAHPSIYRHPRSKFRKGIIQDCSHWCLPGVPDSWNQLLFSSLLLSLEGSNGA
ncbi:Protein trichome birefringence-like 4 [Bienertia sinuspersici]